MDERDNSSGRTVPPGIENTYFLQGHEAYHYLIMSGIHPECPDSDPSDRSVAADVLLRQEPDEEEDEEEDESDRKEDDEDEDTDDGYSE
jgi:hypothetical protein